MAEPVAVGEKRQFGDGGKKKRQILRQCGEKALNLVVGERRQICDIGEERRQIWGQW